MSISAFHAATSTKSRRARACTVVWICVATGFGWQSTGLGGGDPLESGIREAARQIVAVMDQEQKESITLLGVEDNSTTQSTIAGGVDSLLREEFERAGKTVKNEGGAIGVRARVSRPRVLGEFSDGAIKLRIRFELLTANGDPLPGIDGEYLLPQTDQNHVDDNTVLGKDGRLKRRVPLDLSRDGVTGISTDFDSPSAVLVGFGGTGSTTGFVIKDDDFTAAKGVIVGGNEARIVRDGQFGLRILDAQGNPKPLTKTTEGYPFVEFQRGERFDIEAINRAGIPIAATVMVDGLNTFHFSEEKSKHGDSWIFGKRGGASNRLVLKGWYTRKGVQDQFAASKFEESKRKAAGFSRTPLGAISVVFSEAVLPPPPPELFAHITRIIPREGGGEAEVNYKVPGERTFTVSKTVKDLYIAGVGHVSVPEGDPSKLTPGRPLGVISIRYRDPNVSSGR